jgi:hypothetical protein
VVILFLAGSMKPKHTKRKQPKANRNTLPKRIRLAASAEEARTLAEFGPAGFDQIEAEVGFVKRFCEEAERESASGKPTHTVTFENGERWEHWVTPKVEATMSRLSGELYSAIKAGEPERIRRIADALERLKQRAFKPVDSLREFLCSCKAGLESRDARFYWPRLVEVVASNWTIERSVLLRLCKELEVPLRGVRDK